VENAEAAGYLEEPHVVPDSRTETYAALRVYLDDPRWAGVPFYLRAGKRLARRVTEVVVSFRDAPRELFPVGELPRERNRLVLRIQPDEGAGLAILAKQPGPGLEIAPVSLDFRYAEAFMPEPPEAYERLVLDATLGDHTLFAEGDSVEAAWDFVTPILRRWESRREPPADYPAGSWGPEAADRLLAETGDRWHQPGERLRESV
jgi:glucose-6-phosphate 1-dehydrogenase